MNHQPKPKSNAKSVGPETKKKYILTAVFKWMWVRWIPSFSSSICSGWER